jgi:hypothetical protein
MTDVMGMVNDGVASVGTLLTNKWVVAGTALLIGLHQFDLIPYFGRSGFGDMKLFAVPMFGAVTPLRILGVVSVGVGIAVIATCPTARTNLCA